MSGAFFLAFARNAHAAAEMVEIETFNSNGRSLGLSRVEKIVKTEAEWRAQLSPLAFEVTRKDGTERAFTGPDWDNHAADSIDASAAIPRCSTPKQNTPFWHRLAELLRADFKGECRGKRRHGVRHETRRRLLQALRRASWPCLHRRSEANGAALLHERRRAAFFVGRGQA